MTRFLKLVRHQDGNWKSLSTETDDLTPVSVKERNYAPIDPAHLLKALKSLLSDEGGIRGTEDVPRLASLMKKFSKKLVSRCVYCNVLQATKPDILSDYLDKGGWETINVWLQYAKSSETKSFLLEMLKLCKLLPMTVARLKENNTAKLVKAFTKHEDSEVKALSTELVTCWMALIKKPVEDGQQAPVVKKKKKEKPKPAPKKEQPKSPSPPPLDKNTSPVKSPPVKSPALKIARPLVKGAKRPSSERVVKLEDLEDVKMEPLPPPPPPKKPRADRPKTAKVYQKKFRSTGLLEETPLPNKIPKKPNTDAEKSAAVAAAKNVLKLNTSLTERITEKKIKPENLMTVTENSTSKGIKLIKPKPVHILHESASFMDALTSQPVVAVKKRKKALPKSPTSPVAAAPKLQFYKDTLETSEDKDDEEKQEVADKENISGDATEPEEKSEETESTEAEPMEVAKEEEEEKTDLEKTEVLTPASPTVEKPEETEVPMEVKEEVEAEEPEMGKMRSILSHGRRRGKKKSVKWVAEESIKEIFYFELDENERVNVLKTQNFGSDFKMIDSRREREAFEHAKKHGDRMEEATRWWVSPIIIDLPPPVVEAGCQSTEKEIERLRQQGTLQEIYFTKDMIPDTPQEPDLEIVPSQEPAAILYDEDNSIGTLMDYSNHVLTNHVVPDAYPSLLNNGQNMVKPLLGLPQHVMESNGTMNPPIHFPDIVNSLPNNMPLPMGAAPYDTAEPLPNMHPPMGIPNAHPMQNMYMGSPPIDGPPNMSGPLPPNNWQPPMDSIPPHQDQFFPHNNQYNQHGNQYMPHMHEGPPSMNMNPNMRPRIMHDNFRPHPHHKASRGFVRPRFTIPCRHFLGGSCRFGEKCTFLHPGVNGPVL